MKTENKFRLRIVVGMASLLVLSLLAAEGMAQTKTKPVMPAAAQQKGGKVDALLRIIQNAKSLDEIGAAFSKTRLSDAEVKELEAAIKRPPYVDKLKSLSPSGKRAVVSSKPEVSRKGVRVDRGKKEAINRQAAGMVRGVKTASPKVVKPLPKVQQAPSSKSLKTVSPPAGLRKAPSAGTGSSAEIHTVNPVPARVGDRVTISGDNFGSRRGNVELLLSGRRYICDIDRWANTRIEATIPDHMDSAIGASAKSVRLWVKLPETSLGPTSDIQIHPPIRAPQILELSSGDIMPGSSVAIAGRDFGGQGRVDFTFGSRSFRGTVSRWGDVLIVVTLPDGSDGLARTRGQVIIRNDRGAEARHAITFEPDLESVELSMYHIIDRSGNVTGLWETVDFFEHFVLEPGWRVTSYRKEVVSGRGGMRYMLEPTPGTNRMHNIITLDVLPFARARFASRVTIEGPKGTTYR